jgi:hypothetical protein
VIGLNEVWGVNLVSRFPCVVRFWIALPLDEILECSSPAGTPVVDNAFHLIFFLPF